MRSAWVVALLLLPLTAGCLDAGEVFRNDMDKAPCTEQSLAYEFWLDGEGLASEMPSTSGSTPSNPFTYGFFTNDAFEWLSAPQVNGIRILGDVTLDLWIERNGAPNYFVDDENPGSDQAWQLFSQFGTTRGFADDYDNSYTEIYAEAGTIHHLTQTYTMQEGGIVVEQGDQLRLLLTNMGLDAEVESNHDILWGGDTPSGIKFDAVCYIDRDWRLLESKVHEVEIDGGNALASAPPTEGRTMQTVPFTLLTGTERLTIELMHTSVPTNTPKTDMDVTIYDNDGEQVWSIGSPYMDEAGTLWHANLNAFMPAGDYTAVVNMYTGTQYGGQLTITQEQAIR